MTASELGYSIDGPLDAPAIFLGASLGTTATMWEPQVEALAQRWRVIRFDTRGHGRSPVPPGPYSMPELAADVCALADSLDIDRFAYCGLSLGGAIGVELAVSFADRLTSVTVCCTAAYFGDPAPWQERQDRVRAEGTGWLPETLRPRWFTDSISGDAATLAERILDEVRSTPPEGYAGCCAAIAGFDRRAELATIDTPTLVVAGSEDPAGPKNTDLLAQRIPGASLVEIRGGAHLASVEQPEEFNTALITHLERVG